MLTQIDLWILEAGVVRRRGLVNGPVVEWWVDNWVLMVELNKIISIDAVNDHVSEFQVLMTSVTVLMRD